MAKTPPAPAAAPVLDDPVDVAGEGVDTPKRKFSLRLPKLALPMPAVLKRLPLPKLPKIAVNKKILIIVGAAVVGLGGAGAAAYAFWPAEPEWPRTPVVKKHKRGKHATAAASAASASTAAASAAEPPVAAASTAEPVAAAASGPEEAMDKLRRRLGEVMGGSGKLQADGPGELRLTAGVASTAAATRASKPGADVAAPRARAHQANAGQVEPLDMPLDAHASLPRKAGAAALGPVHWSYEGLGGPETWGRLKPEYAKCTSGTRQSPIDIRDGIQVNLDAVKFAYQPSRFSVIDNGHTVQVNVAPGNVIEVMGKRYELQQFHFHRPSEERIDGKQFDMVAHLVHKDADGKLAVVAVLLERGSAQASIDLNQLLPAERGYYTYMGSLTTPPCSEGVLWMVMKKPVPISPEQLAIFARLYPMNARPLQSASGRMIKESN